MGWNQEAGQEDRQGLNGGRRGRLVKQQPSAPSTPWVGTSAILGVGGNPSMGEQVTQDHLGGEGK
jgi:hypothetical protein